MKSAKSLIHEMVGENKPADPFDFLLQGKKEGVNLEIEKAAFEFATSKDSISAANWFERLLELVVKETLNKLQIEAKQVKNSPNSGWRHHA